MFVLSRSATALSLSAVGVYRLPPPGPMPPAGPPGVLPNSATFANAQSISEKLFIVGLPACVMPGKISMSTGDEVSAGGPAGGGGLISGKFAGPAQAVGGSGKLFVGGKPVIRMCDPMMHDQNNAPGNILSPSQTKFTVAS